MSAEPEPKTKTALDIMEEMAATFRERNRTYGDNYRNVGKVMAAFFPDGIYLRTADDFLRWQLMEQVAIKLTRFAVSGLVHVDSIHDSAVYAAMTESVLTPSSEPITAPRTARAEEPSTVVQFPFPGMQRCRIKRGFNMAGHEGRVLGKTVVLISGSAWTPVLWDDEDETPDWVENACLEFPKEGAG